MAKRRSAEEIRSAALTVLEGRGSGARTDGGEPIVDLVDSFSTEAARIGVISEYLRRINSVAGWLLVVTDEAFKQDLAEAMGIGYDRASADFLRSIGAPADLTSDVEALIYVDLSNYAASNNRPRRAASSARATVRLTLSSGGAFALTQGASTKRGSSSPIYYDTTTDVDVATPSTDPSTGSPYVDVSVKCRTPGRIGNAVIGAINAGQGLSGVISVRNITAAEGGRDRESNLELLNALPDALSGKNVNTLRGLVDFIESQTDVEAAVLIGPGDPLMTRAEAGAVDVYVVGTRPTSVKATTLIATAGELFTLTLQPVISISSVVDDLANAYFPGGGFDLIPDSGAFAGSARAYTQIDWDLPSPSGFGPAAGRTLTISYIHDALIRDLQRRIDEDPNVRVPGSDVLVRWATRVGVSFEMLVVPVAGLENITQAQVNAAVESVLDAYISALKPGKPVNFSKMVELAQEATIDGVGVVDHIDGFAMGRTGAPVGYEDITVADNEYLRLDTINFLLV